MAYIIDRYNKYDIWDREHSVYQFEVNGNWYAVKEVELCWGEPQLPNRIDSEKDTKIYFVYDSEDEARKFAQLMRQLN